ncbi:MAG: helix-turn-helix domain-containing protein [Segniliparus sp.]|uniref:helix-turn-helix domain-containing protein n=1 Tax=Segniliparus sp. TaxID=2804064 RepID=UPI003F2D337A
MSREVKEIWDIREIGDIGEYIRTQREQAQVSLRQLAQRAGVSNPYLSQIERGLRKPSAQVMGQIARALRLSAEALGTQAEFLAEREPSRVREAVLVDESITERQKDALIQVYEAFVQETLRTRELQTD